MQGSDDIVRRGCDERAGFEFNAIDAPPAFPQAGENKRAFVAHLKKPRLLQPSNRLPFIETARGHDTASLAQRFAKRGFVRDAFRARIREPRAALRVL